MNDPTGKRFKRYGKRNDLLKTMGFTSYANYLLSEQWAVVKAAALANEPDCACCDQPAHTAHHVKYTQETLCSKKGSRGLVPLCRTCHYKVEFDRDGNKVGISQALTRLLCLLTEAGKCDRAATVARFGNRTYKREWYANGPESAEQGTKARSSWGHQKWAGYGGGKKNHRGR